MCSVDTASTALPGTTQTMSLADTVCLRARNAAVCMQPSEASSAVAFQTNWISRPKASKLANWSIETITDMTLCLTGNGYGENQRTVKSPCMTDKWALHCLLLNEPMWDILRAGLHGTLSVAYDTRTTGLRHDLRLSQRFKTWYVLIKDIFSPVCDYAGNVDLNKCYWNSERKLGVTTQDNSWIISVKSFKIESNVWRSFSNWSLIISQKCMATPNFLFGFQEYLLRSTFSG